MIKILSFLSIFNHCLILKHLQLSNVSGTHAYTHYYLINVLFYTATVKPACPSEKQAVIVNPDGTYLKTLCILDQSSVYHSQAYKECESVGYKLAVIESSFIQTQMFKALTKWWSKPWSINIWIDGVKDTVDGNWYYNSYMKTPVSTDLLWWNGAASDTGCLVALFANVDFSVGGRMCSEMHRPVCEYKNTTTTKVVGKIENFCPLSGRLFLCKLCLKLHLNNCFIH